MSTHAGPERIDVIALGLAAATATTWRLAGQLHVTVIVKGSFALSPNAAMTPVEPEEIITAEVHHNKNPMRSVRLSTDLAPYLPRADVLLTGHAWAPAGQPVPSMSVRLVVFRETALVDKIVYIHGDPKGAETTPFDKMPLIYERAYGGSGFDDNPLGVGVGSSLGKAPNLSDPNDHARPAGFGPLSRSFPSRKRLLGALDRKVVDKAVAELPADFDWTYFQAAPLDQRIEFLRGDEWVILDGFHPEHTHLQSYLPTVRALAHVQGIGGPDGQVLALAGDTLRIDVDQLSCSVVWRASFPIEDESILGSLRITAGIERAGEAIHWPASRDPLPLSSVPPPMPVETVPPPARAAATPPVEARGGATERPQGPSGDGVAFPGVPWTQPPPPPPAIPSHRPPPLVDADDDEIEPLEIADDEPSPGSLAPPPVPVIAAPAIESPAMVTPPIAQPATLPPAMVTPLIAQPESVPPPLAPPAFAPPAIVAPAMVAIATEPPAPVEPPRAAAISVPLPPAQSAIVAPLADPGGRTFEAATQVTIRCGGATVTVDADGKITLTGTSFELHATGPVKVSGALVEVISSGEVKVASTGKVEVKGSGPMSIDATGPVQWKGPSGS